MSEYNPEEIKPIMEISEHRQITVGELIKAHQKNNFQKIAIDFTFILCYNVLQR